MILVWDYWLLLRRVHVTCDNSRFGWVPKCFYVDFFPSFCLAISFAPSIFIAFILVSALPNWSLFGQQISVYFVQLLWLIWWREKRTEKKRPIKPNSNNKINKFGAILFPLRLPMAICATRIKIKFDKSFVRRLCTKCHHLFILYLFVFIRFCSFLNGLQNFIPRTAMIRFIVVICMTSNVSYAFMRTVSVYAHQLAHTTALLRPYHT